MAKRVSLWPGYPKCGHIFCHLAALLKSSGNILFPQLKQLLLISQISKLMIQRCHPHPPFPSSSSSAATARTQFALFHHHRLPLPSIFLLHLFALSHPDNNLIPPFRKLLQQRQTTERETFSFLVSHLQRDSPNFLI